MAGTLQVGGLISGLDTSKIIEQLMAVEQRPLKLLVSQQQRVKARKTALTELAAKLNALRLKAFALTAGSVPQARTATPADPSVATATAQPGAAIQSFDVEVVQLATRSSLISGPIGAAVDNTAFLDAAGFATTPTNGTFTINGQPITITDVTATDTLDSVIAAINGAVPGVTASFNGTGVDLVSTTGPIVVGVIGDTSNFLTATKLAASSSVYDAVAGTWTNSSTAAMGAADPAAVLSSARLANPPGLNSGTFTINGVSFSWDDTVDTINGLISQINSSAAKVTASYDAATDTFSLVAKDTGPAAIAVTDTGGLLGALGITGATQQYGKPAQYKINGGPVQSSTSNTVTNAVSGVTLTLKAVGTTTVDVAQDVATTVNGVKDFIKAYNEALTLIKQQQAVDPAGGSASVFTGSSVIQTIEGRLRRVVNTADSSLTTDYLSLPDIGINTGAIGSSPGTTSQMTLDESKLTTALQTDSTAVVSLLTSATGPLSTLNTYLRDTTSYTGPLNTTQTTADRQLRDIGDRMRLMQQRLDLRQRALEKRFADLETAMAKLQQQSSQLSGQLGQLGALNGG